MDDFVQKRVDIYNFFHKGLESFTKGDILRKEYSVLSFSPYEEYIDTIDTEYDYVCTDLKDFDISEDRDEIYLKGIIIDVDNKKDYSIIHVQNKSINLSILCSRNVIQRYGTYIDVGSIIITRCHVYNSRVYMDFLIDLNFIDNFKNEIDFLTGKLRESMQTNSFDTFIRNKKGLILQITYFTSKKRTECKRMEVLVGNEIQSLICCKSSHHNPIFEDDLVVGDMITFITSSGDFVNNVKKI